MNDDLAGQLVKNWRIPDYAQGRLWLDTESGSAKCEGETGLFELDAPAQVLTLRWNRDDGAPLTQLNWQIDNLGWNGSVRLGGIVEAIHMTHLPDVEFPVAIVMLAAQTLRPNTVGYSTAKQRDIARFEIPDYVAGVDEEQEPMTVPLITFADSPLVAIAQESLTQMNPLYVFGTLDNSDAHWEDYFALPIVWESVTVFSP